MKPLVPACKECGREIVRRQVLVTIPGLDPKLSPNARPHWRARPKLVKNANTIAIAAGRDAWNRAQYGKPFRHAHMAIHYKWCGREPDHDNFVAQCKSYVDGIRRAGVFHDDDPKHLTREWPTFSRVKHKNQVEVIFTITEVS
tara:strand:- start:1390 stop:1818 length:429 start_codon:yes stop_codon:yes gene_type:complete